MFGPRPISFHHNRAIFASVADSHLPDEETEAWKGGVAPWVPKASLLLRGEDYTQQRDSMMQGVTRVQKRSPELRAAGNRTGE